MHSLPAAELEQLNQIPFKVWLVTNFGALHFNQEWRSYFGNYYANGWTHLIHPHDLSSFIQSEQKAKDDEQPWETSVRLRRHDGIWRWHRLSLKPFGKYWIGSAVDIHELKSVEEGQRCLADAVHLLSENLDIDQRLRAVARLIVRRYGGWCMIHLKNGPAITESSLVLAHVPPESLRNLGDDQSPVAAVSGNRIEHPNGSVLINFPHNEFYGIRSYLSTPMKMEDESFGIIAFASTEENLGERELHFASELSRVIVPFLENSRLVTELRRREEKLSKAVEARDIFLSVCSHELRTPVTSLKLMAQLTMRHLAREAFVVSQENINHTIRKFAGQIDRLSQLIEDMLDISRMDSGNFVFRKDHFSLTILAKDIIEKYEANFRELGISFKARVEENLVIYGDIVRIEQVIQNMVNNAIKYGLKKPVTVSFSREGSSAVIRVTDNGVGIPEKHLDKIFKRFERVSTDSSVTGLGLGLYICKQIVETHQGHIEVQSEEGIGSTFSVYLPLKA